MKEIDFWRWLGIENNKKYDLINTLNEPIEYGPFHIENKELVDKDSNGLSEYEIAAIVRGYYKLVLCDVKNERVKR